MESRRDHALLYDDDCGFCKLCVRTMLRLDDGERLNPVAIQSDEGKRLLTEVPEELHLESFHLVTPGGKVLSAGEAAPPLAKLLRGGSIPSRAFKKYPKQTDSVYRWVAGNRSIWGRLGLRSRGPIELEAPGE